MENINIKPPPHVFPLYYIKYIFYRVNFLKLFIFYSILKLFKKLSDNKSVKLLDFIRLTVLVMWLKPYYLSLLLIFLVQLADCIFIIPKGVFISGATLKFFPYYWHSQWFSYNKRKLGFKQNPAFFLQIFTYHLFSYALFPAQFTIKCTTFFHFSFIGFRVYTNKPKFAA